jgi:plastocyanin
VRLNGIADNDNQEGLVTVSSASVPGAFTVNAGNFYYAPTELTINVGDTVYWVNDGGFHNVNFSTNTVTGNPYNNPESFVSNPTSDTEIYSYVFNTAGTYQYDCSVGSHAANGMIGTIIVLENSDPEPGIVVLSGETLDYSSYAIGQVTTNDANGVADSLGLLVSLEGVVHCIDFDGNEGLSFTIIDIDNNGINVYNFNDVSSYVVSEGDLIKVWGVIDQYNGLTEVIPDSIEVLSTGNATVIPSLVTGLNEDTESQWITIQNVDFVTPIATFASGSSNIDVTDGTNVYTLRIDSDTDIPESSTPQGPFDVTGVGGQYDSSDPYDSGYQLFPCGLGSFVPSSTTQLDETMILNVFRAYPNPFNNMIQVSLTQQGAFEIAVMDVQGRILLHESMNQSMNIDTKDWNSGLYMISVQDSKGLVQIQKVIK